LLKALDMVLEEVMAARCTTGTQDPRSLRRRFVASLSVSSLILSALVLTAFAPDQMNTAEIVGVVADPSGAVTCGAFITAVQK
jgi:hypothetical protein